MSDPHEHYYECLRRLKGEVAAEGLEEYFPPSWFDNVEFHIRSWDGDSIFTLNQETFFISYLQSLGESGSLIKELREIADALNLASPKAAIVRNRIKVLAGDTANAIGGLFELRSLLPLITEPNELVELQPKFGQSRTKAEALVKVVGHKLYVEATIFTRQDESFSATGAFVFDPGKQQGKEGSTLSNKILDKARQCEGADRPVVLFLAEGLVTTGLTLDRDPRSWAMSDVARKGGAPPVSAVAFAKNVYCTTIRLHANPNAQLPLPPEVLEWLELRCESGWRT